jgi:hypothetical protein
MEDFPIEGRKFEIPHGLWFLGPKDWPNDFFDLCRSLAKVGWAEGTFVVAFTDKDLARRHLERMYEQNLLQPFHPEQPDLVGLLKGLAALGHTHLSIDAGETSDWRAEIGYLIARYSGEQA